MTSQQNNKWQRPQNAPPPMFLGQKEKNLTAQINIEIEEKIIGQTILYYPISREHTNFHPVYSEAIIKTFLSPIRVYALVLWNGQGEESVSNDAFGSDQMTKIEVRFHRRRLVEDQDLNVQVGDFVQYGEYLYEIVKLREGRELFGQQDSRFEIMASCIRSRQSLFDGQ
jgi:hypothetical protein